MGRTAAAPKLVHTGEFWRLRFTHEGVRHDFKSATIPADDQGRAHRWMAERLEFVYSGRWRDEQSQGTDPAASLKDVSALYLAEKGGGEITKRTATLYKLHLRLRFLPRWSKLSDVTRGTLASYQAERLKEVRFETVKKELSTIRQVLRFAEERGWVGQVPKFPRAPSKSRGTRHKNGPSGFTAGFTSTMALDIIRELPELSRASRIDGERWPLKAHFRFQFETGLRPGLLAGLRYGVHWRKGQTFLHITEEIDKNRWARDVPLTADAIAALESVTPKADGRFFDARDWRDSLRAAAERAGLPEEIARRVHPYDMRHARTTEWVNNTGKPLAVGYLVGHKQATTTNRYSHADRAQAEELIRLTADSGADSGGESKTPEAVSCDPAPGEAVSGCAKERTRTSTGVTPLAPQGRNEGQAVRTSAVYRVSDGRQEPAEVKIVGSLPTIRRPFGGAARADFRTKLALPVGALARAAVRLGVAK
jgi:integrase